MKIRYLHIDLESMEMKVSNIEPSKADLEEVDNGYITIVKVVDGEFMKINSDGNFESIKKTFTND